MRKLLFLALMCMIALGLSAQTSLLNENWESGVGTWVISNNPATDGNGWHIGTATQNGGANSIYISQNSGTSFTYSEEESASYFYREVAFTAGATSIILSFDIHCVGESSGWGSIYDYASVYLYPLTEPVPVGGTDTPPVNAYRLDNLYGISSWTTKTYPINTSNWAGETGRLVFSWYNDDDTSTTTPAAIDNIQIMVISATDPPLPATLVSPANGATYVSLLPALTWSAGAGNAPTGYNVFLGTDNPPATQVVTNANQTTYTPSANLDTDETYYWRVQPVHSTNGNTPLANCPVWSFTTIPPPNPTPFTENWESGSTRWQLVNGTLTNKWFRGTATANGEANTYSMYISENQNANTYTGSSAVVHFFTDIAFPSGAAAISISFDIKGGGENNWDFARVYLMPTSVTPVASSSSFSLGSGETSDPNYAHRIGAMQYHGGSSSPNISATEWTRITIDDVNPTGWAGAVGRLVFTWVNDGSGGVLTGAAIDNISVTAPVPDPDDPPLPVTIVSPANGATMVAPLPTLSWAPGVGGNTPTSYKVFLGTTNNPAQVGTVTTTSYTPSVALPKGTPHFWKIVPVVTTGSGDIEPTETIDVWSFTTVPDGIAVLGTETTPIGAPINPWHAYSVSQQIYLQSELTTAGFVGGPITHIAFQSNVPASDLNNSNSWLIYIGETEEVAFANASSWLLPEDMQEGVLGIYDITPDFTGVTAGDWITIELTSPYIYSGSGNLAIFVNEYSSGYGSASNNSSFRGTSTGSVNRTIRNSTDSTPAYEPKGTQAWTAGSPAVLTTRPNLKLTYLSATTGLDLAVTAFTGPSLLPGGDLVITVTNMGSVLVANGDYTIKVYQGDTAGEPIGTISAVVSLAAVANNVYASNDFAIPSSTYNAWFPSSVGGGNVTLIAKVVTTAQDQNTGNDSVNLATALRPPYDIELLSITGPTIYPAFAPLKITLQNNGRAVVAPASYNVSVTIADNSTFTHTISGEAALGIALGASQEYLLTAALLQPLLTAAGVTGSFTFNVAVTSTGPADSDPTNNTKTFASSMYSGNIVADGIVEVGVGGTTTSEYVPFSNGWMDNVTQSIYLPADLEGVTGGLITHINYRVNITTLGSGNNTLPDPYLVSIYMKNQNKPEGFTSSSDHISGVGFECVAEDYPLPINSVGIHDFWIELDNPFLYTGNGLIVMTNKDHSAYSSSSNVNYVGPNQPLYMTMYKYRDEGTYYGDPFDPTSANPFEGGSASSTPSRVYYRPQTRFAITLPSTGADLALSAFNVPAMLPATDDILVTVTNMGTVVATTYDVKIYQVVAGTPALLHTINTGIEPLDAVNGTVYDSHTYHITAATYNTWWASTVAGGEDITLRAEVTITADVNGNNNGRNANTYLKPAYDIQLVSVAGPSVFPTVHPLSITLQNNGRAEITASSYTVTLAIGGTPIHTVTGAEALAIALDASRTYTIPANTLNATIPSTGSFTFTATVASTTAETVSDNNSATHEASVFTGSFDVDAVVEVGTGVNGNNTPAIGSSAVQLPFSIYNYYTYTQSIYSEADMAGVAEGFITHINYRFHRGGGNLNLPVNIYMTNSTKTSFANATDWVANADFTLVKTGFDIAAYNFANGDYDIWIELDAPFHYTGGAIVVMTHRPTTNTGWNNYDGFYQSIDVPGSNITIYKNQDSPAFTFEAVGEATGRAGFKPQTRFAFGTSGWGIVSGTITDDDDDPISGATVQVEGTDLIFTTGADGEYELAVPVASTARLVFTATSFSTQYKAINTLNWTGTGAVQTATYDVAMVPAPQITVKGAVTFADSGDPVVGVIVTIGSLSSAATDAEGEYEIEDVYADTSYLVTVNIPPAMEATGYRDFSATIFIDSADADNNDEYTLNIAIPEDTKPPIFVSAHKNQTGNPVVSWYSPYSVQVPVTLCVPGWLDYNLTDEGWSYIAANRFSAAMIDGAGVDGAHLVQIGFKPTAATGTFTIYIWTGTSLTDIDVDAPVYTQVVTQPLVAAAYNYVMLDTPFTIPTTGEIAIGIRVPEGNGVQLSGYSTDMINGYGNLIYDYDEEEWYTLYDAGDVPYHWHINGLAIAPGPDGAMRAFEGHFKVYRMAEDETFEEATLLTANPITGGTGLQLSYSDTPTITEPITYTYAVTTVYEGDEYPTYEESAPALSNALGMYYRVSGVLTSAVDDNLAGVKVKLENQTTGGYEPDEITVLANGVFELHVIPGTYHLIVSKYSEVDGITNSYTYADGNGAINLIVTLSDITGLAVIVPQNVADDDISVAPLVTALGGNYPNPFNPTTTIAFTMANEGFVSIDIFNIKGQKVKTLTNELFGVGSHKVVWNGDDTTGRSVGSGVYFYRMTTAGYSNVQKMLLLK